MARKRKKKSSHSAYCKSPYRYSTEYNRWREAIGKGHEALVKSADRLWRQRFCSGALFELENDGLPANM